MRDSHPVGDLGHHHHVVGDEENGDVLLRLHRADEVEDLRLNGNVQRGRRLVGDQDLGAEREGHRDHDPLQHATGQLVRPAEASFFGWLDCTSLELDAPQAFFLERARVGVSDGAEFGAGYETFVRLNYGCPRTLLDEGIDRMVRALAGR